MSALDTKVLIAESFISLVESGDYRKVSVSDIVAASGKNRKTFYYHFSDKSRLVVWIFRWDLAKELTKRVSEEHLVYPKSDPDCTELFPYYTFIKSGVRSIDATPFFEAFDACLRKRPHFYSQVLADYARDGLGAYLHQLYTPALLRDIKTILSNRYLKDVNQQFLAEVSVDAFLSYFTRRAIAGITTPASAEAGPFKNIIHDALAEEITRQQQDRVL